MTKNHMLSVVGAAMEPCPNPAEGIVSGEPEAVWSRHVAV